MQLAFSQVAGLAHIDKIIIHSLDFSLYQVSIELDGREFYLTDNKGKMLRAFNIIELQKKFRAFPYASMVLRHRSAYDEMIGLSEAASDNFLEVPLKDNRLG
ncbi:hypothetical protein SAMN02745866_00886 [Alteromonadaceae bacterium Bs31]|nr:hypothetical protein SAMN02745866_00886 [Alteromonadaceae bacterium Bs31]